MTEAIGQTVTLQQEHQVTIPIEERMMINIGDWERLRKDIEKLGDPLIDWAMTWAAAAAGGAVAVLVAAVSLKASGGSDHPGLESGLWVGFAACLVFALCFGLVGRREKKRHGATSSDVCEDMDDVARRAGHASSAVTLSGTKTRSHSETREMHVA
jgi:hypothetical protein